MPIVAWNGVCHFEWPDQAAFVSRQLTPGLISLLFGTAGLPLFTCFSTSYPELESAEATLKCCWVRTPLGSENSLGEN
jgi:hypothetical protein